MYTVYSKKSSNWECENILPTKVSKFNIVEINLFLCVLKYSQHYPGNEPTPHTTPEPSGVNKIYTFAWNAYHEHLCIQESILPLN